MAFTTSKSLRPGRLAASKRRSSHQLLAPCPSGNDAHKDFARSASKLQPSIASARRSADYLARSSKRTVAACVEKHRGPSDYGRARDQTGTMGVMKTEPQPSDREVLLGRLSASPTERRERFLRHSTTGFVTDLSRSGRNLD
jgi:hypothetical protein